MGTIGLGAYGRRSDSDIIGVMKMLPAILCLAALLAFLSGCSEFESPDAAPQAKAKLDRVGQYASDVATFERAMGKDHSRTPEEIHEIMKKLKEAPVFKNRFLGILTYQNPTDAWIVMEIMYQVKPDIIIEAGTYHGGSAVLWAIVLEHINPDGRVITIDIQDQRERRAVEIPISKRKKLL